MYEKLDDMENESIDLISKYHSYCRDDIENVFIHVEKSFDKTLKVLNTMMMYNTCGMDAIRIVELQEKK